MTLWKGALLGLLLGASALGACVDVAEERARRDMTVGQAELGDVRVAVQHGHAAVRLLGPGELRLWAGAPVLSVQMAVGAASGGPWSITVENVLSDAELRAETAAGEALAVELTDQPAPTQRTWRLDAPAGGEITLTLRPPDAGDLAPWRFAALADVQEAIDGVQDIYAKMNAHPGLRFALFSGDLTARGTAEQLERFQREAKSLKIPLYATLGNHELGVRDDLYHEYYGRGNYSFAFRGARFTMLDSASATIDPLVYGWLEGWLEEGRGGLHMVAMHIPPIDPVGTRNGSFASRAEADKLLSMLAGGGVDLTVYGHVHSYYVYENAGIPAYITGGGGAIPERMDGIGRHFVVVDVLPGQSFSQVAVVRID